MANPQTENGHIRIATEIVEKLARINLSAYEWRVLWCVLRKTWGWRKKSDVVPVSQIARITGLRTPHVSRAKASLLKKHILVEQGGKVGFQKNYELWEIKGFTVTNSGNENVTNLGNKITDSGNATITDLGNGVTDLGNKSLPNQGDSKDTTTTTHQQLQQHRKLASSNTFSDYWNSKLNLPHIRGMTDDRKKKLTARMKEQDFAEHWREIIDKISASAFCTGGGAKGWKANVDWLLSNSTNYVKVLEGKYDEVKVKPEPKRGDPDWLPTEEEAEELLEGIESDN